MENKENVRGLTDTIINISDVKDFSNGIDKLVEKENSLVEKIKDANRGIKSVIDRLETINHIKTNTSYNSIRFFDNSDNYTYMNFHGVDHTVICHMIDVLKLNCEKDLADRKKRLEELIAKCGSNFQNATTDEQV